MRISDWSSDVCSSDLYADHSDDEQDRRRSKGARQSEPVACGPAGQAQRGLLAQCEDPRILGMFLRLRPDAFDCGIGMAMPRRLPEPMFEGRDRKSVV